MARKETDEKRLQFAAHIFVYTTKDGMILSHLSHVAPPKLYQWSTTEEWKAELLFWNYAGDCRIEGEEFHRQVGLHLQKLSLRKAERLWKELFGGAERKQELQSFFGKELPAIEETVGASNLNLRTSGLRNGQQLT